MNADASTTGDENRGVSNAILEPKRDVVGGGVEGDTSHLLSVITREREERVTRQVIRKKRKPAVQVIRNEKRFLEGKARIAAAAASLFLHAGYHRTSVRDIARKAEVSVGLVFYYFASKEEILFFLFAQEQERTEAFLYEQRAEFERLQGMGADARELFLLVYGRYVRRADALRHYLVLGYQELKSLTAAARQRIFAGEARTQQLLEGILAYGVKQGAFPAGDVDVKAHCLLVLAQSWAVRHWALTRFARVDDYLGALQAVALGIVESTPIPPDRVAVRMPQRAKGTESVQQGRETVAVESISASPRIAFSGLGHAVTLTSGTARPSGAGLSAAWSNSDSLSP